MAAINVTPIMMRDAAMTISLQGDATVDVAGHINRAVFRPSPRWTWAEYLVGEPEAVLLGVTWVLELSYAQDLTADSYLARLFHEHPGALADVLLTPVADGPSVSAVVRLAPGDLGGVQGQHLSSAVSLPVVGAPVLEGML